MSRPLSFADTADVLATLPDAVRMMRRARGLRLRDVAEQTGVSIATLSRFECTGHCAVGTALRLLAWLDETGGKL